MRDVRRYATIRHRWQCRGIDAARSHSSAPRFDRRLEQLRGALVDRELEGPFPLRHTPKPWPL